MARPELVKVKVSWTGTDGKTNFESHCWIPKDGPSTISDMTGQIEMLASDYEVNIEVVDEGVASLAKVPTKVPIKPMNPEATNCPCWTFDQGYYSDLQAQGLFKDAKKYREEAKSQKCVYCLWNDGDQCVHSPGGNHVKRVCQT